MERPTPGVRVVETELTRRPPVARGGDDRGSVGEALARGRGDLAGMEQRRGVAPRPNGLKISGRPAGTMTPPPATPAQGAKEDEKKPDQRDDKAVAEAGDDDASIRFSLLELD